jgi:hypothetical protein
MKTGKSMLGRTGLERLPNGERTRDEKMTRTEGRWGIYSVFMGVK